jgi:hypothetical protein
MPDYPPLLKLGDAVELMQTHGILGGKRRLLDFVSRGTVTSIVLPGQTRRYYHRDSLLAFLQTLPAMPTGK